MGTLIHFVFSAVMIGICATAFMDLWALAMKKIFKLQSLNYRMVGRWLCYLPQGKLSHSFIGKVGPAKHELVIGWTAHYVIGVLFSALLLLIVGHNWLLNPTLVPALLFGLISVIAPYFILQPALGAGIAASKTPTPNWMRFKSLQAHASFGVGLFLAASLLSLFIVT